MRPPRRLPHRPAAAPYAINAVTSYTGAPSDGYAPDLLNGDGAFQSDANWTLSGTAAITPGVLGMTSAGRASHSVDIPSGGGVFRVTVTVIERTAGDVTFNFANNDAGTNASTQVFALRTPGIYYLNVTALAGNTVFRINGVSLYAGQIANVSVRAT